jgi:ABC-type nickel/cobalt efflux system permease component RcnA
MDMEFNIWAYLIQVAPVVLVMGIACWELWRRNNLLIDKIHERDIQNLMTLEKILMALGKIEQQGVHHFDELKKHISERVDVLRKNIQ